MVDPRTACPELVSILAVVAFLPTRAEPQDRPAPTDPVDRPRDIREQVGVPIRRTADERPDLDPAGRLGPGREDRPALEVGAVAVAVQRVEVVPGVGDVIAHGLGVDDGPAQAAIVTVLGMELGGDADLTHEGPPDHGLAFIVNPHQMVKVKRYHRAMFRIATFAGLSGVSAKMLRDYDRLGIFRPVWVDASTGYRSYSPAQLPEIRRIVALRDLGVGLAEIERIVSGGADLAAVLDARRSALEDERREVDRRLAALDISVSMAGEGGVADVVVRDIEPESVAAMDVGDDGDIGRSFYALEAYVRGAGRRRARPPGVVVHDPSDDTIGTEVFVPDPRLPRRERGDHHPTPAAHPRRDGHRAGVRTRGCARRGPPWIDGPPRQDYRRRDPFGSCTSNSVPSGPAALTRVSWSIAIDDFVTDSSSPSS